MIFLVILSIIFSYWNYSSRQINDTVVNSDITNKLFLAGQIWFKEGYPKFWTPSNIVEIGLASNAQLNNTKIDNLNAVGYQKVLEFIGVQNYNLYYRVFNESNSTLYEFGIYPNTANYIVKLNRLAVLNRTAVTIESLVWQ